MLNNNTLKKCKIIPFNKNDTFESGRYFIPDEFEYLTRSNMCGFECVIDNANPDYAVEKVGFSHVLSNFQIDDNWLYADITILDTDAGMIAQNIIHNSPYGFRPSYLGRLWSDHVVTDVALSNINLVENPHHRKEGHGFSETPSPNDIMRYQDS